jgi:predicted sulfurtransferase
MNKESKVFLSLAMAMCGASCCLVRSARPAAVSRRRPRTRARFLRRSGTSPPQGDNAPRIEVAELKALVARNEVLILDVRSPDSYKASHAKGAISYPLDRIEKGDFKDIPKDKRIVAYCT